MLYIGEFANLEYNPIRIRFNVDESVEPGYYKFKIILSDELDHNEYFCHLDIKENTAPYFRENIESLLLSKESGIYEYVLPEAIDDEEDLIEISIID